MAYLDGRKLIVAGATGLAGMSILARIGAGHPTCDITALYHTRDWPRVDLPNVTYQQCDLLDRSQCQTVLLGADCLVMAAAVTGGSKVLTTTPWVQVTDNIVMNANLLESAALSGVQRAVWIGSATLYQDLQEEIREDDLDLNLAPPSAYQGIGWVGRYVEQLCRFWHAAKGIEILCGRTSNIYGPYARFDLETSNFIPAIVRKACDRMDPFEVWGSPDVRRDVIYADDFGEGVRRMMNADAIAFDVFNIGSGSTVTVDEVVCSALSAVDHKPSSVNYSEKAPGTVSFRMLNCEKAARLLEWQAKVTVEEGVARTVKWWESNKHDWSR